MLAGNRCDITTLVAGQPTTCPTTFTLCRSLAPIVVEVGSDALRWEILPTMEMLIDESMQMLQRYGQIFSTD